MKEIKPNLTEARLTGETMVRPAPDGGLFPRLKWAAAHYGWAVALFAVAGGLLATQIQFAGGGSTFEAAAVVTARELVIGTDEFPRTAAAIFNAGEVARIAVEMAEVDYDAVDLIPDRVRLEPVENTVVLRVVAIDGDAQVAAALANGAARALVIELERLGAGVGEFGVHTTATVPQAPIAGPPIPSVIIGILAGLVFGVGLVGLALAIRRPVIDGATAAGLTQLPILGTMALSSLDATGDLRSIPQLDGITANVFPDGNERRYLVGLNVRRVNLRLLGIVLVRSLAQSGNKAALVGTRVTREVFGTDTEEEFLVTDEAEAPPRSAQTPTVVLGRFLPEGDNDPPLPSDGSILVVGKGAPARRLAAVVDELHGTNFVGIILLKPLGWRDIQRRNNPQVV